MSSTDADSKVLASYRLANRAEKLNDRVWFDNINNKPLVPKDFLPTWLRFRKVEIHSMVLYCLDHWKVYEKTYIERCNNEKISLYTKDRKT